MNNSDILNFLKTILPIISWILLGFALIQLGRLAYEIIKYIRLRIRIEKFRPTARNIFEALGLTPWKIITVRKLGVLFFTLSLAVGLFGYLNQYSGLYQPSPIVADFYAGISTDFASIAITILIIDYISEKRADEQLKAQLIREMASNDNGIALCAVNELRAHGWLKDGSIMGKNFDGANLQGADLSSANLQGVSFYRTNLSHANLTHADLRKSVLIDVNLFDTNLFGTNLEGVNNILSEQSSSLVETAFIVSRTMFEAIMPNGKKYDGRYNLEGDLYVATEWNGRNLDVETDKGMAEFYKVTLGEYLEGQSWAKDNLSKMFEVGEKLKSKNSGTKNEKIRQNMSSKKALTIWSLLGALCSIAIAYTWFISKHKNR